MAKRRSLARTSLALRKANEALFKGARDSSDGDKHTGILSFGSFLPYISPCEDTICSKMIDSFPFTPMYSGAAGNR
jgi:hypothetical protein